MIRSTLILISILMFWCLGIAEEAKDSLMQKESNETEKTAKMIGDTVKKADNPSDSEADTMGLSTEVSGLDSLGIVSDTLITKNNGGTQSYTLQRQVFHREHPYVYDDDDRRDPFRALIVDEKKEGEIVTDLLRLDGAILTGIVWSQGNYLAMLKDKDGESFFLREGDPVYSGSVVSVTPSQAVFEVIDFGDYDRVTLKVQLKATKKSQDS